MKALPQAYRKTFEWLAKLVFLLVALYVVADRIKLDQYEGIFTSKWHNSSVWITMFGSLWILNLLLDGWIWKSVHQMVADIKLTRAIKTNLVCYALAFITPVNAGELAGRYLMITEQSQRNKTVFLTFWSHFPRLIGKLLLGSLALLYLAYHQTLISGPGAVALAVVVGSIILLVLFNIRILEKWISRLRIRQRDLSRYLLPGKPSGQRKLHLLLLASLKLLTYSVQFIALLLLWSNATLSWQILSSVLLFFTISAFLPTIAIADFVVKGALAMLVLPTDLLSESVLINATFFTWLFNIAIPALAGSLIVLRADWRGQLKRKFSSGNR